MPPPAYMRSGSETSFPSASDSRDASMTVTGLREKKLYALIGCLAILTILALFLLIMNIMLIVSLQMNQHGMKFLRFHNVFNPKAGEMEKVVQFDGDSVDLGTVVTNGNVAGYKDRELYIHGSRVRVSFIRGLRASVTALGFDVRRRKQHSAHNPRKWLQT
ncbi:hypothetical protein Aduo_010474 [Ancylostoma duodenale]